jgi:hypothetical protein
MILTAPSNAKPAFFTRVNDSCLIAPENRINQLSCVDIGDINKSESRILSSMDKYQNGIQDDMNMQQVCGSQGIITNERNISYMPN